jgi:hypothetical protein
MGISIINKGGNSMLSFIRKTIKENCHLSRNHLIYLSITILILFLILSFRDARINAMEEQTTFYEKSVLLKNGVTDQYFPGGFNLTSEQINDIKEEFAFVTTYETTDMNTSASQHVTFTAVSTDFINTGVVSYNRSLLTDMVEKIDLISGDIWSEDSVEPVVIIDEDTASSLFGHTNVVGQYLPTVHGDLRIIGVVTNTTERAQEMTVAQEAGQLIDDKMYNTDAYISYGYLSTISGVESNDGSLIIRDDRMDTEELKARLKEILDVPKEEDALIDDRQKIIYHGVTSSRIFLPVFFSMIAFFAVLETVILMNLSIQKKRKAENPVISDKLMVKKTLLGGAMLGLCCSFGVVMIGLCILLVSSLFPGVSLNLLNLVIISFLIILTYAIIIAVINLVTAVFTSPAISQIKKKTV